MDGTHRADVPGDSDVVVRALLAELRLLHEVERCLREDALSTGRRAIAQVESGIGEQVGDAESNAASRDARRRRERTLQRRRSVAGEMSAREPLDDELAGRGAGVLEAEGLEDEIANRSVDRLPGDHFDDAAGDAEPGVVVAPR